MIRQAVQSDAAQIAAIYNHYVENSIVSFEIDPVPTEEMVTRIFGEQQFPWLVAEGDGSILGFAFAARWKTRAAYDKTVETSVYVEPDAQRTGVGNALYQALLDQLRSDGFHCALGGIALPNPASVAFHENMGFQKVGELQEVGRKQGRWVNVVYWQRIL